MERLCIPFLVVAAFVGASALTHGQDAKASLEGQVLLLREDVAALRTELDLTRALLDETVSYLERRSKAAAELARVLSASEEAGFTFGINPNSREILLAGWRKELADRQKGVPGAPPPAPADAPVRRGSTRR